MLLCWSRTSREKNTKDVRKLTKTGNEKQLENNNNSVNNMQRNVLST